MAYRQGFESELGKLDDNTVIVGGTNAKPGMRLSSQDLIVGGHKLQAFSAVNNSNKTGAEAKHLDPKDFPQQGFHDGQVPGGIPSDNHTEGGSEDSFVDMDGWLRKAQDAWNISEAHFQSDIKPKVEDNIRAFQSRHKTNSFYNRAPQGWTSKLYIPKTRSVLNKHQAAACIAFFSNMDIISIEAENPYDLQETVAVAVRKALIEYRLRPTSSLKWYMNALGAFQDSMVQGVVCGYVGWHLKEDRPEVKIFPLDQVRFDPDCDWVDPVNSSPYWITLREMTIGEYKSMVAKGFFYDVGDAMLQQAVGAQNESLDRTRKREKTDGANISAISDYNRITIQEHIHRDGDNDVIFYTLGTTARVSDVLSLEQVYLHGKRPYVLGISDIESHVIIPSGLPEVMSGLQEETNEITNQKLNAQKMALNPKYVVRAESSVDLNALLRNQPGSAVYTDDPATDLRELKQPDVPESSFMEIQKLDAQTNELTGMFNPPMDVPNRTDSGRTMQLLNAGSNMQLEYRLKTFSMTWYSPMLSLLDLTERTYERSPKILELIARRVGIVRDAPVQMAQAPQMGAPQGQPMGPQGGQPQQAPENTMPKKAEFTFDHLRYMIELLGMDLEIMANVGMNATDPLLKAQKLMSALGGIKQFFPGVQYDQKEVSKELFALSGYADGMKFINQNIDPKDRVIQQLLMEKKLRMDAEAAKASGRLQVETVKQHGANLREAAKIEQDSKRLDSENAKFLVDHGFEREKHVHDLTRSQKPETTEEGQNAPTE